jgi:hypothetical protein
VSNARLRFYPGSGAMSIHAPATLQRLELDGRFSAKLAENPWICPRRHCDAVSNCSRLLRIRQHRYRFHQ